MPQIVQSQLVGIEAQQRINNKDKMRWDPNTYLQSSLQQKAITSQAQKFAHETESLIAAGLVADGSISKDGNMHRTYTDWAKQAQAPPEQVQEQKVEEVVTPEQPKIPSGGGAVTGNAGYALGYTGIGNTGHVKNTMLGQPYSMTDADRKQLEGIIPSLTPDYFAQGGKLEVLSGHDATPFSPKNLEEFRYQTGRPDLTDAEAQQMLAVSRGSDMQRGLEMELLSKGITLPFGGVSINAYKGDTKRNPEQRFSGFGLSGTYGADGNKVSTNTNSKLPPKGSKKYEDTELTPAMKSWKKEMDMKTAALKMWNPAWAMKKRSQYLTDQKSKAEAKGEAERQKRMEDRYGKR